MTEKQLPARVDELDLMALGDVFVKSGFFKDCREHAQAVVKVLAGRELGVGPMAAMTGIHVIEGKPSLGAHLIALGIKRSKRYDYRVKEKSAARCEIEFFERREGKLESIGVEVFTIDEAKAAGLAGRGPWKSHPKAMLFARTIGQGYRTHCPDAFEMTVYAEGEIDGSPPPIEGEVIDAEATRVEEPRPRPAPSPTTSSSLSTGTTRAAGAEPAATSAAAPAPAAPAAAPAAPAPAAVDELARARAEAHELVKRAPDAWRAKAARDVDEAKSLATLNGIMANVRQALDGAVKAAAPGPSTKPRAGAPAFGGGPR